MTYNEICTIMAQHKSLQIPLAFLQRSKTQYEKSLKTLTSMDIGAPGFAELSRAVINMEQAHQAMLSASIPLIESGAGRPLTVDIFLVYMRLVDPIAHPIILDDLLERFEINCLFHRQLEALRSTSLPDHYNDLAKLVADHDRIIEEKLNRSAQLLIAWVNITEYLT